MRSQVIFCCALLQMTQAPVQCEDCTAGNPSLEAWKVRTGPQERPGRHRSHISSCGQEDGQEGGGKGALEQRTMLQQVPLASIADTVVTLPEVHDVPPGALHSQHVEQPGQSWDEWPTNSLWGALAGRQLCCNCCLSRVPCNVCMLAQSVQ